MPVDQAPWWQTYRELSNDLLTSNAPGYALRTSINGAASRTPCGIFPSEDTTIQQGVVGVYSLFHALTLVSEGLETYWAIGPAPLFFLLLTVLFASEMVYQVGCNCVRFQNIVLPHCELSCSELVRRICYKWSGRYWPPHSSVTPRPVSPVELPGRVLVQDANGRRKSANSG